MRRVFSASRRGARRRGRDALGRREPPAPDGPLRPHGLSRGNPRARGLGRPRAAGARRARSASSSARGMAAARRSRSTRAASPRPHASRTSHPPSSRPPFTTASTASSRSLGLGGVSETIVSGRTAGLEALILGASASPRATRTACWSSRPRASTTRCARRGGRKARARASWSRRARRSSSRDKRKRIASRRERDALSSRQLFFEPDARRAAARETVSSNGWEREKRGGSAVRDRSPRRARDRALRRGGAVGNRHGFSELAAYDACDAGPGAHRRRTRNRPIHLLSKSTFT